MKANSLFVMALALTSNYALGNATGIEGMSSWFDNISSKLVILGVGVATFLWILDYCFKIDFLSHFIAEYKRKLVFFMLAITVYSFFESDVKTMFAKVKNPTKMFYK